MHIRDEYISRRNYMRAIIVRRYAARASRSINPAEMLSKIPRFDPGARGTAAAGMKTGDAADGERTGEQMDDDANGRTRLGICTRRVFPRAAGLKAGKAMGPETFPLAVGEKRES